MIRLELIDVVKNQFKDLDISTQEGIIEFSKVVKFEMKLLGSLGFSIQETEEVINFLSTHGNDLFPLINHKNIAIVLRGQGESITLSPLKEKVSEESKHRFREIFSENILNYIRQCDKLNEWNNLKNLFIAYPFIINDWVKAETLKILSLKNQALVLALQNKAYTTFVEEHAYATDVSYFSVLNTIDERYFDEDILRVNYALSSCQKTEADLTILGKMMYALSFYNAYNEDVKYTLEGTKRAAYSLLKMNDTSAKKASYDESSGCIVYIVFVICYVILSFVLAQYVPGEVISIFFLIVNLIFFIAKKMS